MMVDYPDWWDDQTTSDTPWPWPNLTPEQARELYDMCVSSGEPEGIEEFEEYSDVDECSDIQVLITRRESLKMMEVIRKHEDVSEYGSALDEAMKRVLGLAVFHEIDKHESVDFIVCAIPLGVGPQGLLWDPWNPKTQ